MHILEELQLIGPNRRCEQTAIEVWLELTPDESSVMVATSSEAQHRVLARLAEAGVAAPPGRPLGAPLEGPGAQRYADLLGRVALALQQHAGHRVSFQAAYPASDPNRCCVVVEHEHSDAGFEAIRLAILLLEELIPELRIGGAAAEGRGGFSESLQSFLEAAPAQLLPRDAQDIIEAAERLDIPWVKLDRDPYEGLSGDFRIRPNAMLKLGQACRQRVIDGTFSLGGGEARAAMAHDRAQIRRALESLGVPLPPAMVCATAPEAAGAAESIGFPVLIKPRRINRARHFGAVSGPLSGEKEVLAAAKSALKICPGLIVEARVPGRTYKALMANAELLAVLALHDGVAVADVTAETHPATRSRLIELARRLDVPLSTVTLVSPDIAQPLDESGSVVNLNFAPELDAFLRDQAPFPAREIRRRAAEGLLRHLVPTGQPSRIPIVAVTGTNGKTTVCSMIARVMQRAGYTVGRAGTTGRFLNDELLEAGDFAGGGGHHKVLESPQVDLAVLETARGAASGLGLMFDHCDVSVCTNVSADHLGERGIETVEQMAELKLFIVRRARDAVVLNADDALSAAMLPRLPGRKAWLVSARLSLGELRARFGEAANFCIAETRNGDEWVVLHDSARKLSLMPVAEIPATLGGLARFNGSNALQAIAACYQMGASLEHIRAAMVECTTDFNNSPGRLNFYDGLPFRVLFDFAHNEEGHRALRGIVDKLETGGRKLLLLMRRGNTADERIFDLARIVAGGYDYFICRDHPKLMGRQPGEVPALLKKGLMRSGVPESQVIAASREAALNMALGMCRQGDLLVVTTATEYLYEDWERITGFQDRSLPET